MNLFTALLAARRAGAGHAVIHRYFDNTYYVIRYADLYSIANFDTIRYIV